MRCPETLRFVHAVFGEWTGADWLDLQLPIRKDFGCAVALPEHVDDKDAHS